MRRLVIFVAAALLSAAAFADSVTHSYLVGTRQRAPRSVERLRGDDSVMPGRNIETFDIVDAYRADLTDDEAIALQNSPEVRYVEPDLNLHAFGVRSQLAPNELRNPTGQTTPYGVKMVDAPTVWKHTRGEGINVAMLDTGIDLTHPDLKAAYAGGYNTFFGGGSSTETASPVDDEGHGTHVAGTVAATDNDLGVVGVAPGVHLWIVRVMHSDGNGSANGPISNIAKGIQWVVQQKQSQGGNWIISMSLGGCGISTTLANAVSSAVNAGVLVVAAAGNHDPTQPDVCSQSTDNSYHVSYPAAYPGVVAVAAVDSTATVADFSNFGPEVSLSAPGVGVLSTVRVGTGTMAEVTTSAGGTLVASPLDGSPFGTLTGTFVDCGLGKTASDFPAAVNGNIALIKRGDVTFATKVKNAQAAGAAAVIVYNKDNSGLGFTLTGDSADAGHVWPLTVAISLTDGQALLTNHPANVTINAAKDDYASYDGTSMATPHVAAVAALAWSVAPDATAESIKQALLSSTVDLGTPGVDSTYGHGFVNAFNAVHQLNPVLFPVPVLGRAPGRRTH
ncbi:MAG TPA: S8 family serine peptidase [Thermoanaerobaculia bacterium]|nr:S8 family serine peptidase [Thermoanaerobaculia bacterium]